MVVQVQHMEVVSAQTNKNMNEDNVLDYTIDDDFFINYIKNRNKIAQEELKEDGKISVDNEGKETTLEKVADALDDDDITPEEASIAISRPELDYSNINNNEMYENRETLSKDEMNELVKDPSGAFIDHILANHEDSDILKYKKALDRFRGKSDIASGKASIEESERFKKAQDRFLNHLKKNPEIYEDTWNSFIDDEPDFMSFNQYFGTTAKDKTPRIDYKDFLKMNSEGELPEGFDIKKYQEYVNQIEDDDNDDTVKSSIIPEEVKRFYKPTSREYRVYINGEGSRILPKGTYISPDGTKAYNEQTNEIYNIREQENKKWRPSSPNINLNDHSDFSLFDMIAKGI